MNLCTQGRQMTWPHGIASIAFAESVLVQEGQQMIEDPSSPVEVGAGFRGLDPAREFGVLKFTATSVLRESGCGLFEPEAAGQTGVSFLAWSDAAS